MLWGYNEQYYKVPQWLGHSINSTMVHVVPAMFKMSNLAINCAAFFGSAEFLAPFANLLI